MSFVDVEERETGEAVRAPAHPSSRRRIKHLDQRQRPAEAAIEESLSSALLASDRELGQIVREVDEISNALKGGSPDEQSLRVAHHPAVWGAVKQALLERELRQLALTDDLTCLYNRRAFFAAATQLLNLARRKARPALLLFCDVDDLNLINNSRGQREGDLALIRAADALESTFPDADVMARIGGDEFVVLILEASREVERMLLDRLEKSLKTSRPGTGPHRVSLSVGVSWFDPKHAVSLGELLSQAEQAMSEKRANARKRAFVRRKLERKPPLPLTATLSPSLERPLRAESFGSTPGESLSVSDYGA